MIIVSEAIFFDVDGTLTRDRSSWEKVHYYFEVTEEMKINTKLFFEGEIDYTEWAQRDVALWKGKPIKELENALLPPKLIKGVKEGIADLKDAGFEIVLVSGGIDILVNDVASSVGADLAYSNKIGHRDGLIDGSVEIYVDISKSANLLEIATERDYDLDKCIAVGDNINDIEMFELVGHSIAFNPKIEIVKSSANKTIFSTNFNRVRDYILKLKTGE